MILEDLRELRRTSGGDLGQIQMLLSHASTQTTEKYRGMQQNLVEAVMISWGSRRAGWVACHPAKSRGQETSG